MGRAQETVDRTRAIGYVRVSTDKQASSGAGLESQRRAVETECARKGWELTEVVVDEGQSGKSLNRPGLQKALLALTEGKADALVAAKLDRLSRSVADFCHIVDMSAFHKWKLVVVDCQVDTSTAAGEMMAGILVQFAQFERRLIAERTRTALAVKKAQGVRLGRPVDVPSGVVRRIVELRRKGMSLASIAESLNAEGVPTVRGGGKWYASTIGKILNRAG
ncbi:MAG: recombinase family protein [Armatimonadetes bacterium]|nr:recombinase family protein [Armatimonadota bacterium]